MTTQFIANDGRVFDNARECREYEESQVRSNIGCFWFVMGVIATIAVVMLCGVI